MRSKSVSAGVVMVALGVLFLLANHDLLPPLGPLFMKWWPLFLIAAGISAIVRRSGPKEEQK